MLAQRFDSTHAFGERPGGRSRDALTLLLALVPHLALAWCVGRTAPESIATDSSAFFVELDPARAEATVTPPPPPETPPPVPESSRPLVRLAPALPGVATAEATPNAVAPSEIASDSEASDEPAPLLTDPLAGGEPFSMPSGGGSALGGSFGKGGGAGLAQRTGHLAPRDFSRPPLAPNLLPLVRRNYPGAAKMYGYEGTVRVSLLVRSDGSVSDVKVEDADPSGRGFGEACTRTMLQGGAWKPRLDRNGRPVDSPSEFTCTFRL